MKNLKKLLSGMLTIIMMSTMFLVPVKAAGTVQVSSTGSTVIGASSFTWSAAGDVKDNENGYDKKVATTSWGGGARTAEVTLNVEKSGTYTFDVNAVINLTLDGASPLKFSVDGGSQTTLTTSNATVSALATPFTVNGWTVKNVAYKNEIALKKGEHTLTFEIPMRSSGDAVIYAFDCATIKPVNIKEPVTVKANENTTIGTSSFMWSAMGDVKDNENGYDKKIAMTDWGSVARTAEVTLIVEKTGTYSLDVNAVIDLSLGGASPLKFSIDGGSQTTLTASNATVSALATPWTINGWTVKNIAYKSEFVLEEGEHTLAFEIPKRSSGDVAIYGFDCATIRPTNNLATVSKAAKTTFGNSSFKWNHSATGTKDAAYDGTYTIFQGGGATITATKTFYVEDEFEYELEVYAASSVTNENLSNLEFKIDDGTSTVLSSSNSTVSTLANPCRTDAPWTTKSIKYNTGISLTKGMHTITFTVPQKSNGRTEAYFVFDCASFIPAEVSEEKEPITVKSNENTTIGTSSFVWSSKGDVKDNENGYDKTIAMTSWGGGARTAEVTLIVEKTGTYSFDVNAVIDLNLDGASPLKFSIDGGSQTTLTTSNATVSALASPWTINGWTVKNISYKSDFALEEGEHTLTFEIPMRSGGDAVIYGFDCATIRPTNKLATISKAGSTTLGNSSFKWNHSASANNNAAYDGTYTIFQGGGATIKATQTVYVADTHEYELEVYGASSVTNENLSNLEFIIDDGESVVLSSSNSTVSELENPCRTGDAYATKSIKYKGGIMLEEGTHTITFKVPQSSNGKTAAYFAFDCAIISPAEIATVNNVEITTFGNSSFRWNREFFDNNANAADGTYSKAEGAGMTITATKTFYVENADNYKLEVYGASSATNDALSDIEFKIDDGDSTVLSASNSTVRELSDPCSSDYPWTTKGIKYNEKVALSEGMHTITFTVPQESNGRTEAYFVFDCLRIIPDIEIPDIQGIEAEIDDYTLDVGTVSEVTVTDTEGNAIDYATISSSDSNVIYVGVDKKLYAVGVGRATIIVSARKSEDLPEHTASFEVLVGNGGVFVKSIVNNNGEITATYELDGVDPSSLDTYVAVYSDDDRLLHCDMADITDGKSILNPGNVVGRTTIFVWEKGTLRPYYKETIRE